MIGKFIKQFRIEGLQKYYSPMEERASVMRLEEEKKLDHSGKFAFANWLKL